MTRHSIYAHHDDTAKWVRLPYRDSLWLDDGRAVGDVSASEDFYTVFQYGEILDAVATALEAYDDMLTLKGHVRLSEPGHTMAAYIDLEGVAVEPIPGDVIDLGLQVRSGHTGYHGLKYDVGAQRQVCSNGMLAFVSEFHREQSHQDVLDYGLARAAIDAIVEGVDVVEARLDAAANQDFLRADEALLVLTDLGIDSYLPTDEPLDVLRAALREELATDQAQPTLYDTYNAATRALSHTPGITADARDRGLEQAARLLDQQGTVPDAATLGQDAIERRVDQYTAADDIKPYWADEEETLQTLLAAHGDAEVR